MAEIIKLMRPGQLSLAALPPLSLYVHLPWCLRKCPYCDFNSHEWREGRELPAEQARQYLAALRADLEAALPLIWGRTVVSIFIGGGTPSLFAPEQIAELISDLRARLRLEADCEITLEANPGTFERERFKGFREAGVTRLSVGVQSFDDAQLKRLGRVHSSEQARAALSEAASCFETFNIDLMYALPGQGLQDLALELDTALAYAPPHLSVYHLTIEPNTMFASRPPEHLPDPDLASEMLDLITARTAAAGLERYEVSAYGRPGHRCAHNLNYWQFGDYLGIGAGAHSKLSFAHRILRQVRWREPAAYMAKAQEGQAVSNEHEVGVAELPFEFMLNALRLKDGVPLLTYLERTGLGASSIHAAVERARAKGLLQPDPTRLAPTPLGFDFLSDLQSLFLAE
ncbi:radical SAM family heme chaperone HemW [Kinneretia asaccharophila]|uniref:Heme chaperone HemW n=1 Tax=Roseateles asaccharophilus TaxID=582607 RepID=A0A4R6MYX4_9BURK|nr:radical SAM family heme chaperone HemW [Roseateles asaccharophilus]MDN3545457.1 radical SAM family heme chaperone HemW [Roseateles asaccharophilus]TDP07837.1 oxygen-independent coproporphyrinogen-3 oxidase [Roseateles asaccharophilus]